MLVRICKLIIKLDRLFIFIAYSVGYEKGYLFIERSSQNILVPQKVKGIFTPKQKKSMFPGGGGKVAFKNIVLNLPRTHDKLHCKGEPYRLSG